MKKDIQISLFPEEQPKVKVQADYFILISPPEEIGNTVRHFKKFMQGEADIRDENRKSRAHISLLTIRCNEIMDNTMRTLMDNTFSNEKPFIVHLEGVEKFLHGKGKESIVIGIKNQQKIYALQQKALKVFGYKAKSFNAHVTIARNLKSGSHPRSFLQLQQAGYKASFTCSKITMLKRVVIDDEPFSYEVLYEVLLG
jgi:2'-5' RNA ligase